MTITVVLVYPELLGTYGDSGNASILVQRLRWRGHEARVLTVPFTEPVPSSCEFYVIGGGEDLPQELAASKLRAERPLHKAVDAGASVLAICAGLQIAGESFVGVEGRRADGLGLLDCMTVRSEAPRAIGEVLVEPAAEWAACGLGPLTGFENHGAVTELGPGARPAGTVKAGVGNKDGTVEGAVAGRVWGTYLHGPVLARNPSLADMLLSWVVGPLGPIDDDEPAALHAERVANGPTERRSGGPRQERLGSLWRPVTRIRGLASRAKRPRG
jgi:hypothetical protein